MLLWSPWKLNGAIPTLSYIPLFLVGYMSIFDALFAVWTIPVSRSHSRLDIFKNPWLLNGLCWLVPVAVLICLPILNARVWTAAAVVLRDGRVVLALLAEYAEDFNAGGMAAVNTTGLLTEIQAVTSVPGRIFRDNSLLTRDSPSQRTLLHIPRRTEACRTVQRHHVRVLDVCA